MENLNFEPTPDDDSEKSKDKDSGLPPLKRVSLPASALHGHEGAKMPQFEHVFDATKIHHDMLFQKPKESEKEEDKEESDDTTHELPLQELAKEFEAEKPPAATSELTPEEAEQFDQIVEVNLKDLQDLDLGKPSEREPGNLNPPVSEVIDQGSLDGLEGEVPLQTPPRQKPPAVESKFATPADFAAWEKEMQTEDLPEFPTPASAPGPQPAASVNPFAPQAQANMPPSPNVPSWHPESRDYNPTPNQPPAQSGTGGGRPPFPPGRPPMPGGPSPNFNTQPVGHNSNAYPGINPNVLTNPNLLNSAALLHLHAKLNYLDFKRRRGDAIVGTVAGWALARTFRNRRMIRRNDREVQKRFDEQRTTNTQLEQQNAGLRQRMEQMERQPTASPAERVVAPAVAAAAAAERDTQKTAQEEAAEKVRLIHEQHEKALRQQELDVPPDHHVERPSWLSVEIDDKTGKVMEKPTTFEYGQAFTEERRQERQPDRAQGQMQQMHDVGRAAAGMTAVSGLGHGQGSSLDQNAYAQHQPKKGGAMHSVAETASDPWVWAGIIFLLVVFFIAAII